jgi:hypothetical protein
MRQIAGLVAAAALTISLSGCFTDAASPPQAAPADGSSAGAAIPVPGVDAEYQWLATHRPGWRPVRQALLVGSKGAAYDVITITRGTQSEDIYFDISGFFGKTP